MTEATLRERSRLKRRATIMKTALELFAQGGYDATTIAQIAEAAEVSPRTVSLYFPSKLDLALAYSTDAAIRFSDAIAQKAPAETTIDVLTKWHQAEFQDYGGLRALHREMLASNGALRGAQTPEITAARRASGRSLAAELGRPYDDPVVLLVAGAFDGVLAALSTLHLEEGDPSDAVALSRTVLQAVIAAAPKKKKGQGHSARRRSGFVAQSG